MKNNSIHPPDYTQAVENRISNLKLSYYCAWGVGNIIFAVYMYFMNVSIQVASLIIFSVAIFSHFLISRYFKENSDALRIKYNLILEDNWIIDMIELKVQKYRDHLDRVQLGKNEQ